MARCLAIEVLNTLKAHGRTTLTRLFPLCRPQSSMRNRSVGVTTSNHRPFSRLLPTLITPLTFTPQLEARLPLALLDSMILLATSESSESKVVLQLKFLPPPFLHCKWKGLGT